MTDNKPAPRCPYCGEKMRESRSISHCWYMCPYCLSAGPRKIIDVTGYPNEELAVSDATQKAREAAMKRWQEPNRVLTLEEVADACELDDVMVLLWVEFNCNGVCTLAYQYCTIQATTASVYLLKPYDEVENDFSKADYCKKWRCWLRKPTAEEMEAVPWEKP